VIWWAIRQGLKPLRELSAELGGRDSNSLQSLDDARAPREVHALVLALNRLFRRLGESFAKEKRFTADAAHELRTPLSGIKMQAQVAQRARDPQKRERALELVVKGVDRATHLVNQLLELARLDAPVENSLERTELLRTLRERLALSAVMADSKQIGLALNVPEKEISVHCSEVLLHSLFRNLIDNSLRYSPPGGRLEVIVDEPGADSVTVTIHDQGPGVDETQIGTLFERFRRGDTSGQPGSGLGLSIVQRICEIHQIDIQLRNRTDRSGLEVILTFQLVD